ncbi:endo-1,4-beta-xylanase [Lewinella sp. IMCC34183]|uniref:endo-1,4-beta-xylanase n=1 Tax=Lewinella sp. IMCC34183 TaxID=2248762 RepID=UPI000E2640A4|nr:endo-1,4-beta-xylanase [Lewinella sp. IMCC34183]
MQQFYSRIAILAFLLLPAGLLLSQNLILNPGFEEGGEGNEFTNWTKLNGAEYMTAVRGEDQVHSGNRALRVSSPGFESQPWQVQLLSDAVPTFPGNSYTFTIWARAEEAGGRMRFSTQPNALYGGNIEIPTEWTQISYTFTANVEMTSIAMDMGYDDVTLYFDDAEMLAPENPCMDTYDAPEDQEPIATGKGKFIGSVYGGNQIDDFEQYFNQVTPENAGKWGSVEGTRDTFNWAQLDPIRAFAARNNFPFRFHVMLWGAQQPTWLKPLSDEEKLVEIREWFQAVSDHYDGSSDARATLEYLEVVNEFHNQPPDNEGQNADDAGSGDYIRALRLLNDTLNTAPGEYDWIVNAFKLAREYFPCEETKLMLNEYHVIAGFNNTTEVYTEVAQLLKDEGLVDVLGFQGHAFSTRVYGGPYTQERFDEVTAALTANLDRVAAVGLPMMVTELDIDGNTDDTYTPTTDQAVRDSFQLAEYQRVFGLLWNHPSVIGITLWGYRSGLWRSDQAAYLIDPCTDAPRPALAEYLNDSIRRADAPPLTDFDYACPTTSIFGGPGELATTMELFPNPTRGGVTIRFGAPLNDAELRLYDPIGKELLRQTIAPYQLQVDLDLARRDLAPGIYAVTVRSGSLQRTLRLVIAR